MRAAEAVEVSSPARARATAVLVLASCLSLVVPGATARSAAEVTAAQAAAAEVDRLVDQLAVQVSAQDAARTAVALAVSTAVTADGDARAAAAAAASARARAARTVRALYTSGGPVALYSALLEARSVSDLGTSTRIAGQVLARTARDRRQAQAEQDRAVSGRQDTAAAVDAQVLAADQVVRATETVEETLAQARRVLAAAAADARQAELLEASRRQVADAERLVALSRGAMAALAGPAGAGGIPPAYRVLYQQAAARCPGMRSTQLAAVGQVETRHGRNVGPSSAGAQGPMQFMPGTWARYGVDGDGDGVADPWNPADAIAAAATYLCVNGAGQGTAEAEAHALLRYNNAQWYVDLVQSVEADLIAAGV